MCRPGGRPAEGVDIVRIALVAAGTLVVSVVGSPSFAGPAPAPAWQGFYAGVFAGEDLTALHIAVPGEVYFDGISGESQMAGALFGYNHRFAPRIVGGIEGDVSAARGGTYFAVTDGTDTIGGSVHPEWGGSFKGRIGYLASPDTLFYATAGGVVAVANYGCEATTGYDCPDRVHQTLYGWPLAGFGAETAIGSGWRFRYEYDVKFLPTLSFDPITVTPMSGTANIALIHDLGGGKAPGDEKFGYAPQTWTGFYAGLGLGHGMWANDFDGSIDGYTWNADGFGSGGVSGGAFGGYLHQFGQFALGVEAGTYWTLGQMDGGVEGMGGFTFAGNGTYGVRARAGIIVTPSTMIYGLVGWVHTDRDFSLHDSDGNLVGDAAFGRDGREFGGGIETWIGRHVSVRAEYSYATFDAPVLGIPSDVLSVKSRVGSGLIGAVYHFGG